MARGTTLVKLLDLYRAECRLSFNPAHNAQDRDRQVAHIQRTQEWLWEDFDWPLLRVERTLSLQDGQRYYDFPADMHIDRISKAEVFYDAAYCLLKPGIDAEHYTAYNSDLDERQWPPQRWRISEDEQVEIWPIPDGSADLTTLEGTVKFTGIKNLSPLVADGDRADLDDRLIVLFCAAEYLAASGAKDANLKLDQANKRYGKLRGAQMPRKRFSMFGVGQPQDRPQRIPFAVYNKTT
ncbi:hypothetical protein EVC08_004 [Rhizobium phage RHph_N65]|nr:hypothetical protein EVC08_004 [Rhizobium phage RHph_N65]